MKTKILYMLDDITDAFAENPYGIMRMVAAIFIFLSPILNWFRFKLKYKGEVCEKEHANLFMLGASEKFMSEPAKILLIFAIILLILGILFFVRGFMDMASIPFLEQIKKETNKLLIAEAIGLVALIVILVLTMRNGSLQDFMHNRVLRMQSWNEWYTDDVKGYVRYGVGPGFLIAGALLDAVVLVMEATHYDLKKKIANFLGR